MKFIKGFLVGIVGLFAVITMFSLLMPSKVMTVRTVMIHSEIPKIFDAISDLRHWKNWHPVFKQDSSILKFSDPSSGIHAFAIWNSNGKENKLLITDVYSSQINADLVREGENTVVNIISVTPIKDLTNVQVEWKVITKLKWYPWEKFSGIFIDKLTGPGYEEALNNLKELIEDKP